MGWLKIGLREQQSSTEDAFEVASKVTTQHVEDPAREELKEKTRPVMPLSTHNSELPFIESHEVTKYVSKAAGGLCRSYLSVHSTIVLKLSGIVVDDIVYDCTDFVMVHPGGSQVIESFAGAECSWQFWRFHGKAEMEQYGQELRVGRTSGLQNRFLEPVKYKGLRRLGDDDW